MDDSSRRNGSQLTLKRDIGLFSAIAIVVGQMIGSGIYMAPQGLAQYANPSAGIIALTITGVGSLLLALCFAKMSVRDNQITSPLAATQAAFGALPAFWSGWSYWTGCWVANGAIVMGGVSYLSYFFPSLSGNSFIKYALCIFTLWFYTILNIIGIRESSVFNLIITLIKLAPLAVIVVVALFKFDAANLSTFSSEEVQGMGVIPTAMAYTLWSFLGFEGICVNAAEVKNPRIIMRGTVIGTSLVIGVYLILTILAAGNLPQETLVASDSPFADIIQHATGGFWAGGFISIAVCISAFGCTGAWIISSASIAFSLGEQGLMPATFAKINTKYRTPVNALLINCILMSIIMIIAWLGNFAEYFGNIYNFFVMLATLALLVFYALGSAAEIYLAGKKILPFNLWRFVKNSIFSLLAFIYAIFTVYGSGADYVLFGFILILIGIPFYIYVRLKREQMDVTL